MRVIKAKFWFRGYEFEFGNLGKEKTGFSERYYTRWVVVVIKNNTPLGRFEILAFVPSACICRRILKRHFKKPISKKRKKLIMKNLVQN